MIPKIIHQLWIGPKPPPTKMMDTWRDKHPGYEYIRWSEREITERGLPLSCMNRINEMEEINGKADIIRWEILYHYGGIFLDADSICIEPFDDLLLNDVKCFAGWENEQCRAGLAATGTMAFPPKHPLVRECIEWIQQNDVSVQRTGKRAWMSVGPLLLTNILNTKKHTDMTIYPSYYFLPEHFTGLQYNGHGRVFAFQEWGSTKQTIEQMDSAALADKYMPPKVSVSVLVSSYNTEMQYVNECLDSIKHQNGHFHMELVWINDGSDESHSVALRSALEEFKRTTRFITVVYSENDGNKGLGYSMAKGVEMCTNEFIFRMDSDDVMILDRIRKQLHFMTEIPDCVICGTQVRCFNNKKEGMDETHHPPVITLESYKQNPSHWFLNHPSVCFRKSAVLAVGNYNADIHSMVEDFDLWLRLLKRFGKIYNIQEVLLNYRIHEKQLTFKGGEKGPAYWHEKRVEKIKALLL
jgi:GT2 family glycosyltransferase